MKINQQYCPCCNKKSLYSSFKYLDNKINLTINCRFCKSSNYFNGPIKIWEWKSSLDYSYYQWCVEIEKKDKMK